MLGSVHVALGGVSSSTQPVSRGDTDVSAARKVLAVPRDGSSRSRLARAGAFTAGVLVAERLFPSTDPPARTALVVALYRDEVDAIREALGSLTDIRLGALVWKAFFG